MTPRAERFPRTVAECRQDRLGLWIACTRCGGRHEGLASVCSALDSFTVEELQRAGWWRCDCGQTPAVGIFGDRWGMRLSLEYWHGEGTSAIRR